MVDLNVLLIVIDSFCGAGGVTEGFHRAEINGNKVAKVVVGINHDALAIESHKANHPDTHHFVEDFTELDPHKLVDIITAAKLKYPNAKVLFWASAECTHHSKAKGGMPRDADSRSLPEHIERYAVVLNPDMIGVENVIEFIDWGPLSEAGKPVKEQKGIYYNAWRDGLLKHGYEYEYQKLNAADYGAYTSRSRYFGIFSKSVDNIQFPIKTHSKKGDMGLEKWKAVKDVLELEVEGESIFERKKDLVDATLERILNGIERFVIGGTIDFMIKYNSMSQSKKYKSPSVDDPCPTISCQNRIGVVKAKHNDKVVIGENDFISRWNKHERELRIKKIKFMSQNYTMNPVGRNFSLDNPARTVVAKDQHQILTAYYGNGYNSAITDPCGTVTTKDRFALVTSKFLDEQYGNGRAASIEVPAGTLTTNPKQNLVSAQWLMDTQFKNTGCDLKNPCPTITANRKHFYLMNPQFNCKGASIEKPCFTLIARMDKMPPYLMSTESGTVQLQIFATDTDTMKKLKALCNDNGIIDIKMRMLMISELLRIQGFGDKYQLKGSKADMKKFIGNAVECTQAKVLAEGIAKTIINQLLETA